MSDAQNDASASAASIPEQYVTRARELGIDLPADGLVEKRVLADLEGVSGAAVSKWIKSGAITGSAIVGEGRRAKVFLPAAYVQRHSKQNINQTASQRTSRAAQEMAFVQDGPPPVALSPARVPAPEAPTQLPIDEPEKEGENRSTGSENMRAFEDARLRKTQAEAQIAEGKARAQSGQWITLDDHIRAVTMLCNELVTALESVPLTIGEKLATRFEALDEQAVVVACEDAIREHRQKFATRMRARAEAIEAQQ